MQIVVMTMLLPLTIAIKFPKFIVNWNAATGNADFFIRYFITENIRKLFSMYVCLKLKLYQFCCFYVFVSLSSILLNFCIGKSSHFPMLLKFKNYKKKNNCKKLWIAKYLKKILFYKKKKSLKCSKANEQTKNRKRGKYRKSRQWCCFFINFYLISYFADWTEAKEWFRFFCC